MANKKSKESRAEHAIVNYFLQERGKFVSFKQLKKKFSNRFHKDEIHGAVTNLVKNSFLESRGSQFRYAPEEPAVEDRRPDRKIIEGVVDMTASGHAYIISPDSEEDIWIDRVNLNTAMDGDKVRVVLTRRKRKKPEGKIVEVIERAKDTFIGILQGSADGLVAIVDKRMADVYFIIPPGKSAKGKIGDKVVVRLISWEPGTSNPIGEVVGVLGEVGKNETEMRSILLEFGFRLQFPKQVLQEAQALSGEIPAEEISRRRDFRGVTTFTIDPEDAKDFDDAISFRKFDDGNFEIGIHIADVTHFVAPGSALDKEALMRATSVYLVDRTVPMLPEKLSNEVCSLTPEKDKLTFSAVFIMNSKGEISKQWFGKSIIHSQRRFAYEEAQHILEGKEDPLSETLRELNVIAGHLRQWRFKEGAINFETAEVKFRLDSEARPVSIFVKERKEAHMLIEDFMLLANRKVAEYAGKRKGRQVPFVYRVHDLPDDEKLKDFAEFARLFGYKLDFSTPKRTAHSFNKMIDKLKGKPEQYMLEALAIRTMAKAVYSTKNIGHYGLAFEYYTHFTSPIRRYPDMMVHRILQGLLDGNLVLEQHLEARCNHSSEMERNAAEAERTSVKLKQVEFMEGRVGEIFNGIVSGVTDWGIFVITEDSFCEGLVRLNTLVDDYYVYDEKKHLVKGMRTGKKYQLGDKVKVQLIAASIPKRTIDFTIA